MTFGGKIRAYGKCTQGNMMYINSTIKQLNIKQIKKQNKNQTMYNSFSIVFKALLTTQSSPHRTKKNRKYRLFHTSAYICKIYVIRILIC